MRRSWCSSGLMSSMRRTSSQATSRNSSYSQCSNITLVQFSGDLSNVGQLALGGVFACCWPMMIWWWSAHDYERSATELLHRASGMTCLLTSFLHRHWHFQAALEDSSVWTVIRLTTDLVTCPWSFAYGRINTVVNNNNNNNYVRL